MFPDPLYRGLVVVRNSQYCHLFIPVLFEEFRPLREARKSEEKRNIRSRTPQTFEGSRVRVGVYDLYFGPEMGSADPGSTKESLKPTNGTQQKQELLTNPTPAYTEPSTNAIVTTTPGNA